jgi:DNA polymerase-1
MREIAFDVETNSLDPLKARLVGISFCEDGNAIFLECSQSVPLEKIRNKLSYRNTVNIGHNLRYDLHVLFQNCGLELNSRIWDTMIAAHLLGKDGLGLKERALKDLGMDMKQYNEINHNNINELAEYAKKDAEATYRLKQLYLPLLNKENLYDLFVRIEMPLIDVLLDMERTGIKTNRSYLEKLKQEIPNKINHLQKQFYSLVEKPINMNSPKQLSGLFFEDLKLKPVKYSKKTNNPSVDVEALEKLAEKNIPHAKLILEHRLLSKLLNTYIIPILEGLDKNDRIHTSFNQTATATGRLSSSKPNLQNIPVRSGPTIRRAFIPGKGKKLICADYSQIELRILAHFSQDSVMLEAFRNHRDLHSETASMIFRASVNQITQEMRNIAKTLNFGLIYGMGPQRLAGALKIPFKQAQDFMWRYFSIYKDIKQFEKKLIYECSKKGYVTTLFGRKRRLTEINLSDHAKRSFAERAAINTPIQGTAAEIIKLAMIALHNKFKNTDTKMLVQIHDELLFETPEDNAIKVAKTIKEIMENIIHLKVPLVAGIKICNNWAEK